MNDRLERYIEVLLSVGGVGGAFYGAFTGCFGGSEAMVIIVSCIALYQSTSIAKIIGKIS